MNLSFRHRICMRPVFRVTSDCSIVFGPPKTYDTIVFFLFVSIYIYIVKLVPESMFHEDMDAVTNSGDLTANRPFRFKVARIMKPTRERKTKSLEERVLGFIRSMTPF